MGMIARRTGARARTALALPLLAVESALALRHARRRGIPGLEFAAFGRKLGRRLLRRGQRQGLQYWLNPVSIVRYFEFDFARRQLPSCPRRCLDVSSPRLFSLYVASRARHHIHLINPDRRDLADTRESIAALQVSSATAEVADVAWLRRPGAPTYDCIWSLSVIEHISGVDDDTSAVRTMFDALEPGGRLILTFPVGRTFRDEFRAEAAYAVHGSRDSRGVFFERRYDDQAIHRRLIDPLGVEPTTTEWFGERSAGRFDAYVARWLERGIHCTVSDPREIADHYRAYASWAEMPGMGVCGLVFDRREAVS
jgi:hypothetical protein